MTIELCRHEMIQAGETLRFSSGYDETIYRCTRCDATEKHLAPYIEEPE